MWRRLGGWLIVLGVALAAQGSTVDVYYDDAGVREGRLNTKIPGAYLSLADAEEQLCGVSAVLGTNRLVVSFEVDTTDVPAGSTISGAVIYVNIPGANHTSAVLGVKEVTTGVDSPTETTFNASAVTGSELDDAALVGNSEQNTQFDVSAAVEIPDTMSGTINPEFLIYLKSGTGYCNVQCGTVQADRIYLRLTYTGAPTPTITNTPGPTSTITPTPTTAPTATNTGAPTATPTFTPVPTARKVLVEERSGQSAPEDALTIDSSNNKAIFAGDLYLGTYKTLAMNSTILELAGGGSTTGIKSFTGGTLRSYIDSSGNFGVGPSNPLALFNPNRSDSSTNSSIRVSQSGTGDSTIAWAIEGTIGASAGLDNSVSGDPFVITYGSTALGTQSLAITTSGTSVAGSMTCSTYFLEGYTTLAASSGTGTIVQTHGTVFVTATNNPSCALSFASAGTQGRIVRVVMTSSTTYPGTFADDTYQNVPAGGLSLGAGDAAAFMSDGAKWIYMSGADN